MWIPAAAVAVWLIIWRVKFDTMENVFGIAGLALLAFSVAVWRFGPDWGSLLHEVTHPNVPSGEGAPTYFYWAIALFGAAMTPYEVFFFSSGAVEERWTKADLSLNRANVYLGFPLGGILSLSIMAIAALVLLPLGIDVGSLSQVGAPVALELGKVGLGFLLLGFLAAVGGASIETAMSVGLHRVAVLRLELGEAREARVRRRCSILSSSCRSSAARPSRSRRSTRSRSPSTPSCSPRSCSR